MPDIKSFWKHPSKETDSTARETERAEAERKRTLDFKRHARRAAQKNEEVKYEEIRKEAREILEKTEEAVRETGLPFMYKFPADGADGKEMRISVGQVKNGDPVFRVNGTRTSMEEAVDVLAAYGKGAGGFDKLENEMKDPNKLSGVLEEMSEMVKNLKEPVTFKVGNDTITMDPSEDTVDRSIKEKFFKMVKETKESAIKKGKGFLLDYPYQKYKEIKNKAEQMAAQTK